jgi:dihydrodipicolinate synthase/N-acetylneuraminate lyase
MVAVKDDVCGEFGRKISLRFGERVAIASGGQKQNFLDAWPYGAVGYLSTYMRFKPEIAWRFWRALEARDLVTARDVIRVYDMPFFDLVLACRGGFDAGIHAAYELFGVGLRWRRSPYYSLNDAEVERLAAFFRDKALL